jgi:hypothetical protein
MDNLAKPGKGWEVYRKEFAGVCALPVRRKPDAS